MNDLLSDAAEVLKNLKQELSQCRRIWTSKDTSHCDSQTDNHGQKKLATSWIYGTTDMLESNELILWRSMLIPQSKIASMQAKKCIRYWHQYMEFKGTHYKASKTFTFTKPNPEETLFEFLTRMASEIEQRGWGKPIERRAFKAFLRYVRRFHDEGAFVEHFSEKDEIASWDDYTAY